MNAVDKYIKSQPKEGRIMLEEIRKAIKSAAPKAEETISWRMPMYKYHGLLVGFAAFKNHVSLFVASSSFLNNFRKDTQKYEITKGSIHFPLGTKVPLSLVKKSSRRRLLRMNPRVSEKKF